MDLFCFSLFPVISITVFDFSLQPALNTQFLALFSTFGSVWCHREGTCLIWSSHPPTCFSDFLTLATVTAGKAVVGDCNRTKVIVANFAVVASKSTSAIARGQFPPSKWLWCIKWQSGSSEAVGHLNGVNDSTMQSVCDNVATDWDKSVKITTLVLPPCTEIHINAQQSESKQKLMDLKQKSEIRPQTVTQCCKTTSTFSSFAFIQKCDQLSWVVLLSSDWLQCVTNLFIY